MEAVKPTELLVPTLMYHHVTPLIHTSIAVPPSLFMAQITTLYEHGWRTISIDQVLNLMRTGETLPSKSFIITFDDAYDNVFEHALPVLQDFDATACVYVVSDYIGKHDAWNHRADTFTRHLHLGELSEWLSKGLEVGCHTKTHQCLVKLDDACLEDEICGAQAALERDLGVDINFFCYPYGTFDHRVRNKVAQHFKHAFAVETGTFDWSIDIFALQRIFIGPNHDPATTLQKVSTAALGKEDDYAPPRWFHKLVG